MASLILPGCATTITSDPVEIEMFGASPDWSAELTANSLLVISSRERFQTGIDHRSGVSQILVNSAINEQDFVTVLVDRRSCTHAGRDYEYESYVGVRRVRDGDYILRGCARVWEPRPEGGG